MRKMERWSLLRGTVPFVLSAAMIMTGLPMTAFATEEVNNTQETENQDFAEGKEISAIYGTAAMTYYQYYQNEVSSSIALNEDGYYDAVTSATKGSHTSDIASIHNYYSSENDTLVIDGLKTIDVVIQGDTLNALLTEMNKEQLTTEDYNEIASVLNEKGITITYFQAEGVLYEIKDNIVSEDEDQKLDIAYAKPLNSDLTTYGANIAIDGLGKNTNDILNYVANNKAVATVEYGSAYGDFQINIHYSGTEGATGMGISLAGDSDMSIWSAYKNNIYAVTFTDDSTNETYGAVWYEDIWSENSHGTYLEVAFNKEDRTIKSNTVKAGRYKDMPAGTYTATVKSRGYEDVVVEGIEVGTLLSTVPTLKNSSFSTEDTEIALELETEGVDNDYINALQSADKTVYSLTRTLNGSTFVVEANISLNNEGKNLLITPSSENFAYGTYTLTAAIPGYQIVKYSFNVISSQSKLAMKVGEKVYSVDETVKIVPGTQIYLVDEATKAFVNDYGNRATVAVNEMTIPSRGPSAVAVLKYSETDGYLYIDTSTSPFISEGTYEVRITSTGFNTYTYAFTLEEKVEPTIFLNKAELSLYTKGGNNTATLIPTVIGDSQEVNWASSNSKVAKVDKNGKVTAAGPGTATITATANNVFAICKVTVKETTIKLNKTSITLYTKGSNKINLKATAVGAKNGVSWSSSNTKVAKVDKNGKVTAVGVGTAVITAKANDVSSTCKISVKKPTLSLSKSKATIKVGKKVTIKATASPTGKISYQTKNNKIATVSSKGIVKGKKKGTTTVSVSCNGVTKKFKVIVK